MDGPVERLGAAAVRARWVAQTGVGHKEASYNEGQAEYAKQNWSPDGTPACLKDLSKANGEAEREQPADEEVGDLHPPLVAQAETAPIVVPRTVAGTSGTFDQ